VIFLRLSFLITTHFDITNIPHIHRRFDFDWKFFLFFEFMASRMTMFYKPQVAQMNKKTFWESSLILTLMQHPHDEDPEP